MVFFAVLASTALSAGAGRRPNDKVPAFDFSDAYLRSNGIDPDAIVARIDPGGPAAVGDPSPHEDLRDVRILETTGGFDASGNLLYYTVTGMANRGAFSNDAAGARAMAIANSYRAFIFPRADGNPLSPAPSNRRQDNVFDTRNGYFSGNPLGLWLLTFVSWDGPNVDARACRRAMRNLRRDNGRDLDGTPVINTAPDLENLHEMGCIEFRTRPEDGTEGPPWVL